MIWCFLHIKKPKNGYEVSINGLNMYIDGRRVIIDENDYNIDIRLHRNKRPEHLFTKEEIEQALISEQPGVSHSLVIDLNGYPELVSLEGTNPLDIKGYAVRCETFGPGYIGTGFSDEEVDYTYKVLLEGWLRHLDSGLQTYQNYSTYDSEDKLIEEIEEFINDNF